MVPGYRLASQSQERGGGGGSRVKMKGVQLTILQRRPGSTKSAQKGDPPLPRAWQS